MLRSMQNVNSYQVFIKTFPVAYGSSKRTWGRTKRKPVLVHVNIGTRVLFAKTVLVTGADGVLVTQPEKYIMGMNTIGVIRQTTFTPTKQQTSCRHDVRWPE